MTAHDALVTRATRWLRNTLHCRVVLSELVAYTASRETPDVIGWVRGYSVLVECKTSRADFLRDMRKSARMPSHAALGHWRFYLTEPGLLDGLELPYGWGWYAVYGRSVRHAGGIDYRNAAAPPLESCRDSEVAMLVSALSRIEQLSKRRMCDGEPGCAVEQARATEACGVALRGGWVRNQDCPKDEKGQEKQGLTGSHDEK